jgi:hypothetical protein
LFATAGAIHAINNAVGKTGGVFDRIGRMFDRVPRRIGEQPPISPKPRGRKRKPAAKTKIRR